MSIEAYRKALEAAVREYEVLGQERIEVDRRLAEVAQTIGTLSRLCGLVPSVPWGLTDACRVVLRGAGVPMTPVDIRERLSAIGFDLSKYSNELAAVHTVVKRLNDSSELRVIARGAGKDVAYVWNRPARAAELGADVAAFLRERELEDEEARREEAKKKS